MDYNKWIYNNLNIEKALDKHRNYISEVKKASNDYFDSIPKSVFNNGKREAKIYRNKDTTYFLLLVKDRVGINIYEMEMFDFSKEKKDKEILKYALNELEKGEENIHQPTVFYFPKKLHTEVYKEYNDLQIEIKKLENQKNESEKLVSLFNRFKETTEDIGNMHKLIMKTSSHLCVLKKYTDFLEEKGFLNNHYSDNFYKDLSLYNNAMLQEDYKEMTQKMNYLLKMCQKEGFNSEKNKFTYNDGDYHVWLEEENLVIVDQNVSFYFDKKDNKNYTVYMGQCYEDPEKSIKRFKQDIQNNTVNELKDVACRIENGKVMFANGGTYLYCLTFDMDASIDAYKEMKEELKKDKEFEKRMKLRG